LANKLKLFKDKKFFNDIRAQLTERSLEGRFNQCYFAGLATPVVACLYPKEGFKAAVLDISNSDIEYQVLARLLNDRDLSEEVYQRAAVVYNSYDFSYFRNILALIPEGLPKANLCFYYLTHKKKYNVSGDAAVVLEESAIPTVVEFLDHYFEIADAGVEIALKAKLVDMIQHCSEKEKIYAALLNAKILRTCFDDQVLRLLLSKLSAVNMVKWYVSLPVETQETYASIFYDILDQKDGEPLTTGFNWLVSENEHSNDANYKSNVLSVIFSSKKLFEKVPVEKRDEQFEYLMLNKSINIYADNIELICRKIIQQKTDKVPVETKELLIRNILAWYLDNNIDDDVRTLQMIVLAMVSMQVFEYKKDNKTMDIFGLLEKIQSSQDKAAVLSIIFSFGTQLADRKFDHTFSRLMAEYLALDEKFRPGFDQLIQVYTKNLNKPELLAKIDEELCKVNNEQYVNRARVMLRLGSRQQIDEVTNFLAIPFKGTTRNGKRSFIENLILFADYDRKKGWFKRRKASRSKYIDALLWKALANQSIFYRIMRNIPVVRLFLGNFIGMFSRRTLDTRRTDDVIPVNLNPVVSASTAKLLVSIIPDPVDQQLIKLGVYKPKDKEQAVIVSQTVTIQTLLERLGEIFSMEKSAVEADHEEVKLLVNKVVAYFLECRRTPAFAAEVKGLENLFVAALRGYISGHFDRRYALEVARQKRRDAGLFGQLRKKGQFVAAKVRGDQRPAVDDGNLSAYLQTQIEKISPTVPAA